MPDANLEKAAGYAITRSGGTANSLARASGYVMATTQGGLTKAAGYQIYTNPSSITKASAYQVVWPGTYGTIQKAAGYQIWVPLFPPVLDFDVTYAFIEERFPDCISFTSSGGPGFMTNVVEFDSGIVSTDAEWEQLRAKYNVSFDVATPSEISLVEDFFYVARGRAIGFRYKDWQDYQIVQQNVGIGDGTRNAFQLFKRYQSGNQFYDRKITKPLKISSDGLGIAITVDGVIQIIDGDVFINESQGIISFSTPPPTGAIIRVEYGEFDVPVRFDTDKLDISFDDFRQLSLQVPLVEIRL